ncbi:MAG: coenzyme F420-0:L-glutamate ligase [Candidatus Bathyarchaeia archaeon]
MKRYKFLAITTQYWKPNENYVAKIVAALKGKVQEGDIIVVSEKAISTATGNLIDESGVKPSLTAKFLAKYWMRYVWVYVLGPLCHLRKKTIRHFRNYPIIEGSIHKQVILQHCGFLQALMQGSEGGIDGSNLPYSYVSLPLNDAYFTAETIRSHIKAKLGKNVIVMIVDTDKTYSWRNFHFTPRPKPIKGIWSIGGFISYVVGRSFKLKKRATPVAVTGAKISVEEALEVAELANRARGFGAGRTVWDMAKTFNVSLTGVSWKMLKEIEHKPIVVVRPIHLGGV